MSKFQLKPVVLMASAAIVILIIGMVEGYLRPAIDGTLLLTLTFFAALIQGSVALAAAAEAAQGKWIEPLKKDLLSFYPLIPFIAVLFLFLGFKMDIYEWYKSGMHHQWLERDFFMIRNFVMLMISYLFAHLFVKSTLQNKKSKQKWAILYIFSFVTSQSLIAFDWVMSLEYPWMSTLFGGIFFMEAFFCGIALLGIIAAVMVKSNEGVLKDNKKVMRDSALFMLGFALAWAGLFYAQYLTIWYGNLPFETSFYLKRMDHSPYRELLVVHAFMLFVIPFVGLIPKKVKSMPNYIITMACIIILGVLVERIYYILPVTDFSLLWLIIEFILLGAVMVLHFLNRDQFLKTS